MKNFWKDNSLAKKTIKKKKIFEKILIHIKCIKRYTTLKRFIPFS